MTDLEPFGCLSVDRTLEVLTDPHATLVTLVAASLSRDLTDEEKDAVQLATDRVLIGTLLQMGLSYDEAVDKVCDETITQFKVTIDSAGTLSIEVEYSDG